MQERGSSDPLLLEMSQRLKDMMCQWFMPQLLELRQVTWESPCDLLEKVGSYEAVHPLRHWKELKHRLGPNRRCFVFMHRSLPREPVVILHVALTREPASSIKVYGAAVDMTAPTGWYLHNLRCSNRNILLTLLLFR